MSLWNKRFFLFLSFAWIFVAYPALSGAATFCVTTLEDDGQATSNCTESCDLSVVCSLRSAIAQANDNNNEPTVDIINFAPSISGTMTLFSDGTGDDSPVIEESLQINGPGAETLTIDANENDWALYVFGPPGMNVVISKLAFKGTNTSGITFFPSKITQEGGVSLIVSDCVIDGEGGDGFGIFAFEDAGNAPTLTIERSTISNNTASDFGDDFGGGGLSFFGSSLTIRDSTFSANTMDSDSFGGGGIALHDDFEFTAELTNVTISGNETDQYGGGILIDGGSEVIDVTLKNVTIANNEANAGDNDGVGGGLVADLGGGGTLRFENVLIADNTLGPAGGSGPDCAMFDGSISSNGFNLVRDDTNCTGLETSDITGEDPLLADLNDNPPGDTDTQALSLSPPSPAINAGDNADCPPNDQRGVPRPQGSACDIGAFEAVVCGDGTTGPGEDCETDEECCADDCQFEPAGTACTDGTCNAAGQCVADTGGGGCALGSEVNASSALGLALLFLVLAGSVSLRRRV